MYLLFKYNKLTSPSEFKKLGTGEKIILAAFIEKELEEKVEKYETMEKSLN